MYMYVCMYVCNVCMYTQNAYADAEMYAHTDIYIYIYMYILYIYTPI